MKIVHQSSALQNLAATPRELRLHGVLQLQPLRTGWLHVTAGRVWLTRSGDLKDHVLAQGQAIELTGGGCVTVEPWRFGESVNLRWIAGASDAPSAQPAGLWRFAAPALRGGWARVWRAAQ